MYRWTDIWAYIRNEHLYVMRCEGFAPFGPMPKNEEKDEEQDEEKDEKDKHNSRKRDSGHRLPTPHLSRRVY
jgi:hypothetical protein